MARNQKSISSRIWFIVLLAVVMSSGLVCFVALVQAREAVRTSTRQRMIDIANCAAGSVNGDDLKSVSAADKGTEKYKRIYDSLAVFRDNIESEYVYGIREEADGRFTFTVDPALVDPGEFGAEVVKTDALVEASKGVAAVDEDPYSDEWGTFYSAYSPVFDSKGSVAGIIAVDFSEDWYEGQQKQQTRRIIILYILILIITLIVVSTICFEQVRTITDPMKHITQIAKRYQAGDFSRKLEIDRQDELGVLSGALQSMASSLTEQIRVAEEASRAKSDFLASMSHEIRTPINAMMGNNEMILRESTEPSIRAYSDNIRTAGGQLLGLVDEILAYSKTGPKPVKEERKRTDGGCRYMAKDVRILAVDDNPMNLQVFLNLVKRTGMMVDTAESGDEGIRLAEQNKYDVLVLDHMMPEKDGIETLAQLRTNKKCPNIDTPAVCLTANAIPGAREFYLDAGFDDYLTKPVDPDELEEMLFSFIPDEKKEEYVPADERKPEGDLIPEKLDQLRGGTIDIDVGIKNNGSIESYMALLDMFYNSMEETISRIDGFYSDSDDRNYTIKIHALKSSLRIIGVEALAEEAQKLEDAGKRDDGDYISQNHAAFIEGFRKLEEELSVLFTEDEAGDEEKPYADERVMMDSYARIHLAAGEMDCDALEDVFKKMDAYRIPESDAELFKKLKAASDRFEYGTIMELLKKNDVENII